MKISQFLEAIKGVDPELDISNWLQAKQASSNEIMSVEEAAKALPIIVKYLGKPHSTTNLDYSGKWLGFRRCIWNANNVAVSAATTDELIKAGVKNFKITQANWFTIFLPADLQFRDVMYYAHDIPKLASMEQVRRTQRLEKWKRDEEKRKEEAARWEKQCQEEEAARKLAEAIQAEEARKSSEEAERKERLRLEELRKRRLETLADPTEIKRDLAGD